MSWFRSALAALTLLLVAVPAHAAGLEKLDIQTASGEHDKAAALRAKLESARPAVHADKLGQLADEFDRVHSIERARKVGSVQAIVPAARLRPYLIDAVRRGMERTLAARREGG